MMESPADAHSTASVILVNSAPDGATVCSAAQVPGIQRQQKRTATRAREQVRGFSVVMKDGRQEIFVLMTVRLFQPSLVSCAVTKKYLNFHRERS